MKHLFLPYELCWILREKGYDEPCLAMYHDEELSMWLQDQYDWRDDQEDGFQFTNSMWDDSRFVAAPLYQQIVDWFREKHNIGIVVAETGKVLLDYIKDKEPEIDVEAKKFRWYFVNHDGGSAHRSYYEALTEGIKQALKMIP